MQRNVERLVVEPRRRRRPVQPLDGDHPAIIEEERLDPVRGGRPERDLANDPAVPGEPGEPLVPGIVHDERVSSLPEPDGDPELPRTIPFPAECAQEAPVLVVQPDLARSGVRDGDLAVRQPDRMDHAVQLVFGGALQDPELQHRLRGEVARRAGVAVLDDPHARAIADDDAQAHAFGCAAAGHRE